MTLRVLIADDEAPARRKIGRFLHDHADIEIVAEASNGIDALDLIALTKPNIAFLDVQMPDLDGLGIAETIAASSNPPAIVFVTAFDQYAVKAFEVRAHDYLLKPYDRERFDQALERARAAALAPARGERIAELLAQARNEDRYVRRVLIAGDAKSFFVATRDISRLESDGNNVLIHTPSASYAMRSTLESLESRLNPDTFARVHRSHIVNIDSIAEIRPWFHGDYKLLLRDGTELAWSRRYAAKRPDLLK